MFNESKYTKYYYHFINIAKNRQPDSSVYYEKHHIIPKSLGGRDTKDNLIKLTAKEHYICHRLLVYMVNNSDEKQKMRAAIGYFCNNTKRKLPSRYVTKARLIFVEYKKGQIPWNKGKPWSDEIKAKISKKKIGIFTLTEQGRKIKSNKMKTDNPMNNIKHQQAHLDGLHKANWKTQRQVTNGKEIFKSTKEASRFYPDIPYQTLYWCIVNNRRGWSYYK